MTEEEIVARCIDSLINEGARLLDESVAGRAADIDVVWANGYGFPRWRGGPMYYADGLGLARVHAAVVARARGPDARYWQSADCLARLAQSGGRFAQTGASGQSEPRGR